MKRRAANDSGEHTIDELGRVADESKEVDVEERASLEAGQAGNDFFESAAVKNALAVRCRPSTATEEDNSRFDSSEVTFVEGAAKRFKIAFETRIVATQDMLLLDEYGWRGLHACALEWYSPRGVAAGVCQAAGHFCQRSRHTFIIHVDSISLNELSDHPRCHDRNVRGVILTLPEPGTQSECTFVITAKKHAGPNQPLHLC
jgi:hypothetical protein